MFGKNLISLKRVVAKGVLLKLMVELWRPIESSKEVREVKARVGLVLRWVGWSSSFIKCTSLFLAREKVENLEEGCSDKKHCARMNTMHQSLCWASSPKEVHYFWGLIPRTIKDYKKGRPNTYVLIKGKKMEEIKRMQFPLFEQLWRGEIWRDVFFFVWIIILKVRDIEGRNLKGFSSLILLIVKTLQKWKDWKVFSLPLPSLPFPSLRNKQEKLSFMEKLPRIIQYFLDFPTIISTID